ncbi:MAG: molybdopterin-guanine dinucleotide biosynthesis protein B [Methylotenera sp.]|nr:molybdopterin-guanine dinucleotide biosynthesis protein B [Methylotenera sp.]
MNNLPILGIVASGSNAGKTTLITQLLPELTKRHIRVSVIKHAHHLFDIDHPGKDSYNIREAGAVQTLVASGKRWALMTEMTRTPNYIYEANLDELIQQIDPEYADLILVEGFKQAVIPKIEVYRANVHQSILAIEDSNIIAVACDTPLELCTRTLDLNNIPAIADFIMAEILTPNA